MPMPHGAAMETRPTRIRLSRARGWRMPENTVKVDRTTPWGNPYDVHEYGAELSLHLFEDTACGCWSPSNVRHVDAETAEILHAAHTGWLRRFGGNALEHARTELRSRNLACWCPLPEGDEDDKCHAAILLRIANR